MKKFLPVIGLLALLNSCDVSTQEQINDAPQYEHTWLCGTRGQFVFSDLDSKDMVGYAKLHGATYRLGEFDYCNEREFQHAFDIPYQHLTDSMWFEVYAVDRQGLSSDTVRFISTDGGVYEEKEYYNSLEDYTYFGGF